MINNGQKHYCHQCNTVEYTMRYHAGHKTVSVNNIISTEKENILLEIKKNEKLVSDLKVEAKKFYKAKPYPPYDDLMTDNDVLSEYVGYSALCLEHQKSAVSVCADKLVYLCEECESGKKLSFSEAVKVIRNDKRSKLSDIDSKINDCKKKISEAAKNILKNSELLKQSDKDILKKYIVANQPKDYLTNKAPFREILSSEQYDKITGYYNFDFECMVSRYFKNENMLKHIFINCDDNTIKHIISRCAGFVLRKTV